MTNHIKRYELINALIEKNNYKSYLEIGVGVPANCFDYITCEKKRGVEPVPKVCRVSGPVVNGWGLDPKMYREEVFIGTSDEFFIQNKDNFDIIFIDGLHKDFQVLKDYQNSLKYLNEGGVILSHDNLPGQASQATEEDNGKAWWGTGWRATAQLRMHFPHLDVKVLDTDCGLGIVKRGEQKLYPHVPQEELLFDYYIKNRVEMLNVISTFDFINDNNLPLDCDNYEIWEASPLN